MCAAGFADDGSVGVRTFYTSLPARRDPRSSPGVAEEEALPASRDTSKRGFGEVFVDWDANVFRETTQDGPAFQAVPGGDSNQTFWELVTNVDVVTGCLVDVVMWSVELLRRRRHGIG